MEMNVYEISFNASPFLSEEALAQEFGNIKENLSKAEAVFISEQYPKQIDLAYTMERAIANKKQKFNRAFFGWIKFEAGALGLAALKEALKRDDNIIRFLIVRTIRENTLAQKKIWNRDAGRRKVGERTEEKGEVIKMDKEAVDKEIEALVAV